MKTTHKFHMITKPDCRYCKLAKNALSARGLVYTFEELTPESWEKHKTAGMKTVPQIWVSGTITRDFKHIGGFTDLVKYLEDHYPE
jgi:glutaredoxin